MEDDSGHDEKIVAVPTSKLTHRYQNVADYTDLPQITVKQIEHFFAHYKDLEPDKWVKIVRWGDVNNAKSLITEAIAREKGA
jgi:inorganic pyrophosphatase